MTDVFLLTYASYESLGSNNIINAEKMGVVISDDRYQTGGTCREDKRRPRHVAT